MFSSTQSRRFTDLTPRTVAICAIIASLIACGAAGVRTHVARADVGLGNSIAIGFGPNPRLLPTLHATASAEANSWSYTAKGYFKIAGKTAARLASFEGTADTTPRTIKLNVSRTARHNIGVAAKRHHAKRVTLTLVIKATRAGGGSTGTFSEDSYLTLPLR
jgi:hypothetical protein